jgi:hypothetical protein
MIVSCILNYYIIYVLLWKVATKEKGNYIYLKNKTMIINIISMIIK